MSFPLRIVLIYKTKLFFCFFSFYKNDGAKGISLCYSYTSKPVSLTKPAIRHAYWGSVKHRVHFRVRTLIWTLKSGLWTLGTLNSSLFFFLLQLTAAGTKWTIVSSLYVSTIMAAVGRIHRPHSDTEKEMCLLEIRFDNLVSFCMEFCRAKASGKLTRLKASIKLSL